MKITTLKEQVVEKVSLAERITGKKETLPVLSCILIEAGKDLVIRATNLESGIEAHIPAEISDKGILAVPAAILSQTIRSINSDKISLKKEDENLIIESRGTRTLIKSIPHGEFPSLSMSGQKESITISREKLLQGLQSTLYASSTSMIRPELGSVFVSIHTDRIVCAATDSFRLAEKVINGTSANMEMDLLIPLKHAGELIHILEHMDTDSIRIFSEESQLILETDSIRYFSRIIDGQFPNYKEIIPKQFTTEATLLKGEFSDMLRKARVFAGNDQHVGLHVYPKKKLFTATARSEAVGEMSDSVDAALSGDDLDINFHIGYLAECLSSIQSDSITLGFSGIGRPLVIRGVSDTSFMYLVMPLNR